MMWAFVQRRLLVSMHFKRKLEEKRKRDFLEMRLYGKFEEDKQNVKNKAASWIWLRCGDLKRSTEKYIIGERDQTLVTNAIKYYRHKTSRITKCKFCAEH